jgi:hypothetical protein
MPKRITVFVCATYMDLSEERGAILDAIQRLQLQHDSMEFFGARPERPLDTCLAEVRKSDIVVVIVGQKYGSIVPNQTISYSEAEYQEAQRLGLPCLIYVRDKNSFVSPSDEDENDRRMLDRWKTLLSQNHTVYRFKTSSDLALQVAADLSREIGSQRNTGAERTSGYRDKISDSASWTQQRGNLPKLRFAARFGDGARQLLYCLAMDKRENIIVGGSFWGEIDFGGKQLRSTLDRNIFIAKFDVSGRHLWSWQAGGSGEHVAVGIETDDMGSIFIVSAFNGTIDFGGPTLVSTGRYSIALAKLTADGKHVWSRAYGDRGYYVPEGLAVSPNGQVVVAGRFTGSIDFGGGELTCQSSQCDIFLCSVSTNGDYRWARRFGGPSEQQTRSIAISAEGETAVAGVFKGSIDFDGLELIEDRSNDYCGFLAKLDDGGRTQWCKRFGEPSVEQGSAVVFDHQTGDVITSGFIRNKLPSKQSTSIGARCLFARYDSSGILQWSKTFGKSAFIESLSIVPSGRILVSGYFSNDLDLGLGLLASAGGFDIFAALFEADGTPLWSQRFGDERQQFLVKGAHSSAGVIVLAGSFHGTIDFGNGPLVASGYDGRSEGTEDVFLAIFKQEISMS